MPLLDSFCVDHVKMKAPGVRLAKTMKTPKGDDISVFDLRFCKPNEEIMPEKGTHTRASKRQRSRDHRYFADGLQNGILYECDRRAERGNGQRGMDGVDERYFGRQKSRGYP